MHANDALARRSVAVMMRGEIAKCAVKGGRKLKKSEKSINEAAGKFNAGPNEWHACMHTAQLGIVLETVLRSMIESFAVASFQ